TLSEADRAAWTQLWAKSDYPDMPLGPFAVDGSANLSQAAKNKNFEIRAMTIGDPKAVAKVGKLLHEPLYNNLSKPVQLARYVKADGVPDLFRKPAPRETRIGDPGVVFVATNPIYENDASEIWPIRSALQGNAIV